MTAVEQSIDIHAPLDRVFDAVTDPRRAPEWNPDIVEFGDFSGYPVHPGTTWRQTVVVMGRRMRLVCRVAEYNAPDVGVIEITGDQHGRVWTRCQAVDGVCRLTQGMEFTLPGGFLGRLGAGFVKGRIEQELYGTMLRQKQAMETEGDPPTG